MRSFAFGIFSGSLLAVEPKLASAFFLAFPALALFMIRRTLTFLVGDAIKLSSNSLV